jgi:hypothetical protein
VKTSGQDTSLLPPTRRLWFKLIAGKASKRPRRKGQDASKEYELDCRECAFINSALSDATDVSRAIPLKVNVNPKLVFQGQNPVNEGFFLQPEEAAKLLAAHPSNRDVVFPYMIGRDLVQEVAPTRWIIDFGQRDMLDAMEYQAAFQIVKERVMNDVLARADTEKTATGKDSTRWTRMAERWWLFRDYQPGMMAVVAKLSRYIVCPRITKRPVFAFLSSSVHADGKLAVFAFQDDYSFGVLQSSTHWLWFTTKCGKLTERFCYTGDTVFSTFPWPQAATAKQVQAIANAGREIRRVRAEALLKVKGGLRALYRMLELPGANPLKDAHAALDAAVLAAYGFSAKKDLLAQLLALNLEVAAKIGRGEPVTAPGVPKDYPDAKELVTTDCIHPQVLA